MIPFIVMSVGWAVFSGFTFLYGIAFGVRHYDEILLTIIMQNHKDKIDES